MQLAQPPPVAPGGHIDANLTIETASAEIHYQAVDSPNNTVFSLLLEAGDRLGFEVEWIPYEFPAGVFVTAINGTRNGEGGHYWQYWVNGAYGDRAADRREIFSGDSVIWKLDVAREG